MPEQPELWIQQEESVGPGVLDIGLAAKRGDVEAVRVFRRKPPFVLGEIVAIFVGEDALENAARFVGCDPEHTESHDWRRVGGSSSPGDPFSIWYRCARCGAEDKIC